MNYGNYSRISFDESSNYHQLYFEQGQHTTDAELNEIAMMHNCELRQVTQSLFPWHGSGEVEYVTDEKEFRLKPFLLSVVPANQQPLTLEFETSGNYYVDGRRFHVPEGSYPVHKSATNDDGEYLVYLHGWLHEDSKIEFSDPKLVRTTSKEKNSFRLEVQKLNNSFPDNIDSYRSDRSTEGEFRTLLENAWISKPEKGLALIGIVDVKNNPLCVVDDGAETETDPLFDATWEKESTLGRIEIHAKVLKAKASDFAPVVTGPLAGVTAALTETRSIWLKWSRSNGDRTIRGTIKGTNLITSENVVKADEFVEVLLTNNPPNERGVIYKIKSGSGSNFELENIFHEDSSKDTKEQEKNPVEQKALFRVWDDVKRIPPNKKVECKFDGMSFQLIAVDDQSHSGDYWQILFRDGAIRQINRDQIRDGKIWKQTETNKVLGITANRPPHFFAPLWVLTREGGNWPLSSAVDLRVMHLPISLHIGLSQEITDVVAKLNQLLSKELVNLPPDVLGNPGAKTAFEKSIGELQIIFGGFKLPTRWGAKLGVGLRNELFMPRIRLQVPTPEGADEPTRTIYNNGNEAFKTIREDDTLKRYFNFEGRNEAAVDAGVSTDVEPDVSRIAASSSDSNAGSPTSATDKFSRPLHLPDDAFAKTIPVIVQCQPLKHWLASATVGTIRKERSINSLTAKISRMVDIEDHELPAFEQELTAIYQYVHSSPVEPDLAQRSLS